MLDLIDDDRRQLLRLTALSVAAAPFASVASAAAAGGSFGPLKQLDAGLLNVGYVDVGRADAPVVILLHGWPYDIYSYANVAPRLVSAGYRVIVPHLRGYGTTRFLSNDTVRNGQQSALGVDVIALMDALRIQRAVIGGFDWGARTANVVAALWPERCKAMVSVSGYLIGSREANKAPLPPKAELEWWYQFYFATERGRLGYDRNRREFARLIWKSASPTWQFDDATFERSKNAWRGSRSSRCPPSRWRGMSTERPIPIARLTRRSSRASTSTGSSAEASGTTCRRRRRLRSRRPSSTSRRGRPDARYFSFNSRAIFRQSTKRNCVEPSYS
jgi:pimeloyl-ACP methyl ester carboxylesterase